MVTDTQEAKKKQRKTSGNVKEREREKKKAHTRNVITEICYSFSYFQYTLFDLFFKSVHYERRFLFCICFDSIVGWAWFGSFQHKEQLNENPRTFNFSI